MRLELRWSRVDDLRAAATTRLDGTRLDVGLDELRAIASDTRLGRIRQVEAESAARAQLEELKRARIERLVPMVLPERIPAR